MSRYILLVNYTEIEVEEAIRGFVRLVHRVPIDTSRNLGLTWTKKFFGISTQIKIEKKKFSNH